MQLAAAEHCGDFDAADRFKFRVPRGGFAEFSETGDGVVVGQGGGFEAGRDGQFHEFGGGAAAVRTAAVGVQIDITHKSR